ncbi:MAG: SUMF1/EgtB/PvdO family nonheme iron enzyme [Kiritimatiellae bacterium]|nr:SUMF1/EgtB/PvdO family nonheme iron enzyme [Kiritimatiellia bacterium]
MGKVAIVGVEGSGKTVLMGALCECYKQGAEGEPYLMPENQAAFMFMERVPHLLRVDRLWPEATSVSGLKSMRWTLRLGAEVLEEIEMLDYPGELYRIAFGKRTQEEVDAHRAELDEFLEHLTEADTLIVLLNIEDTMNLGANPRHAETVWITRGIFDLAKNKLPNIKRKSLVFSQADRFQTMLEVQGGAQGVYAKQLPMMKKLYPDLNVIAVSAVSATDGEGRPKAGYSADGCRELMGEILWEEGKALQAVLEACDRLRQTIRDAEDQADRGVSPATYMRLLDDYLSKAEEIRPFPHSTGNKAETRKVGTCLSRAGRYAELRKAIEKCDRQPKKVLATREGWRRVIEEFDGCDELIDGFVEHYRNEVKSDRLLTVVVGVVIASMYVFFMSVIACENKARQAAEQESKRRAAEWQRLEAEKAREDAERENKRRIAEAQRLEDERARAAEGAREEAERENKRRLAEAQRLEEERAAAEKALQDKVAAALTGARAAKEWGRWTLCLDKANEALELEAGNAEAAALKREMEGYRVPSEGQPWVSTATGMEFIWVPALNLWVGKYEVTNGEYRKMNSQHNSRDYKMLSLNGDRQPVVFVDFHDARTFARWQTMKEIDALGDFSYRVPTETEWQKFAQCGDYRTYPWGDTFPPKYGNYPDSAARRYFSIWTGVDGYTDGFVVTCPVEESGVNDWGLYGVGGNVWECCATRTDNYSFGSWRGGSYAHDFPYERMLRCDCRGTLSDRTKNVMCGFRLVLSR